MADRDNKGIEELTGQPDSSDDQGDQGTSDRGHGGRLSDLSRARPPRRPTPGKGVDTGGVPRQPITSSDHPQANPPLSFNPAKPAGPDAPNASPVSSEAPGSPAAPSGAFDQSQVGEPLPETPPEEGSDDQDQSRPDRRDLQNDESPGTKETSGDGSENADSPSDENSEPGGGEAKNADGNAGAETAESGETGAAGAEAATAAAETAEVAAAAAETAEVGAAAISTAPIWGAVGLIIFGLVVLALLFFVVIVGIAGSHGGSSNSPSGGGTVGQGSVTATGATLRKSFTSQNNITYQNPLAQTEISQGHVADHVLQAVLWVAQQQGIGNLAISAAWCGSHPTNPGDLHCPGGGAQGSALDIGSTGTTDPKKVNQLLCDSALKDKNPYHINELFGIVNPGCALDHGKPSANYDPPTHVHVGTDGGV